MKIGSKILIVFLLVFGKVNAQISSSANFIKGAGNDALKMVSAYLLPYEKAISLNGANNNMLLFKGSNQSDLQFGVGFDFTSSFIKSDDFTFNVNDLDLETFEPANPTQVNAQTIAGDESTITLQTKAKYRVPSFSYPFYVEKPILTLNSPKGTGKTSIPFARFHFFAEKEGNLVEFKILPPMNIQGGSIGIFDVGFNLQHNLETSIESLSELWFDIYISAGYNYNRIVYYLDIKPDDQGLTFSAESDNGPYDNQGIQVHSTSIPISLRIAKQMGDFTFSGGSTLNIANSKVRMAGIYPVYLSDPLNLFKVVIRDVENPFEYKRSFNKLAFDASISYRTKHISAGFRYTKSYYSNITLALGYLI